MAEDAPRGWRGNSGALLTQFERFAVGMSAVRDEAAQGTGRYLRAPRSGQTSVLRGLVREADWADEMRDTRNFASR